MLKDVLGLLQFGGFYVGSIVFVALCALILDRTRFWNRKDLIACFVGVVILVLLATDCVYHFNEKETDHWELGWYCFFYAAGSIWLLVATIRKWKERNNLEKHREWLVSDHKQRQDIQKNHEVYRDDLKKWIERNRPLLATWKKHSHSLK